MKQKINQTDTDSLHDTNNINNHDLWQVWDISFDPNCTPIVNNTHYSGYEYGDYITDFTNSKPIPPENFTLDEQSYSQCSNQYQTQNPNNSSATDELQSTVPENTHFPRTLSPIQQRVSQRELQDLEPIINQRRRVVRLTLHPREINGNLHQTFAFDESQN